MIDMHTHILPGIDDGASTLEEAIMLTEYLYHQKVSAAVCTPHFYPMESTLEDFISKRAEAMEALDHSKIRLIAGSETYLHPFLFHYNDLHPLCIESTDYMLLEFPDMKTWNQEHLKELERIIGYYSISPIIAHIDRYKPLLKSRKLLKKFKDMGCLLQMNTGFIANKDTRRKALSLIEDGYVDLLGSDCHNISYRPPVIGEARKIIQLKLGMNAWDRLMLNAEMVLNSAFSKTS